MDLVEVIPTGVGSADVTALVAERVVREALTGIAVRTVGRVARVPATLMDGKALAERIRGEVAREIEELGHVGLATVLVGDDPASEVYIRLKHRPRRRPASTRGTSGSTRARRKPRSSRSSTS